MQQVLIPKPQNRLFVIDFQNVPYDCFLIRLHILVGGGRRGANHSLQCQNGTLCTHNYPPQPPLWGFERLQQHHAAYAFASERGAVISVTTTRGHLTVKHKHRSFKAFEQTANAVIFLVRTVVLVLTDFWGRGSSSHCHLWPTHALHWDWMKCILWHSDDDYKLFIFDLASFGCGGLLERRGVIWWPGGRHFKSPQSE